MRVRLLPFVYSLYHCWRFSVLFFFFIFDFRRRYFLLFRVCCWRRLYAIEETQRFKSAFDSNLNARRWQWRFLRWEKFLVNLNTSIKSNRKWCEQMFKTNFRYSLNVMLNGQTCLGFRDSISFDIANRTEDRWKLLTHQLRNVEKDLRRLRFVYRKMSQQNY